MIYKSTTPISSINKVAKAAAFGLSGLAALAFSLTPALTGLASAEDCVQAAPEVTYTSAATQTGAAGSTLQYNVNVKNVDSATCENSNVSISHNSLPADWTIVYDHNVTALLPGQSQDYAINVTSSQASIDGDYDIPFWAVKTYSVITPEDPFATVANFNLVYTVTDGAPTDVVAPVVSIVSPADGTTVLKGSTTYIIADASDNVAVTSIAYFVNGELVCFGNSESCAWQVPDRHGKRTYNIEVRAYDAAGNSSSVTSSVQAI